MWNLIFSINFWVLIPCFLFLIFYLLQTFPSIRCRIPKKQNSIQSLTNKNKWWWTKRKMKIKQKKINCGTEEDILCLWDLNFHFPNFHETLPDFQIKIIDSRTINTRRLSEINSLRHMWHRRTVRRFFFPFHTLGKENKFKW